MRPHLWATRQLGRNDEVVIGARKNQDIQRLQLSHVFGRNLCAVLKLWQRTLWDARRKMNVL